MTDILPPDRALLLAVAAPASRPPLRTLFALDDRFAAIVRTTREPIVGQMRLTWWSEALAALDRAAAPAEPLLQDVQRLLLPAGIGGGDVAALIDGWEVLIAADSLDAAALNRHAAARGERLFVLAGRLLGADLALLAVAGRGWALADLAAHLSDPAAARLASDLAGDALDQAFSARWPARLRPIGLLGLLSLMDRSPSSPLAKSIRILRFRLTGS